MLFPVVTCPHCFQTVSLTWSKYFKSPFRHHACPSCGKRFKVEITATSFVVLLAATVIAAGMPAVIAFFFARNFWFTIATYLFFVVVIVIPFDRWLDNKVRPVKPVHEGQR